MSTLQIQEHVQLAPFTTIGVGGSARFFAHVSTEGILVDAIDFATRNRLPVFVLGGGSNLLVRDEGFPGLVLHLDIQGKPRQTVLDDREQLEVPAGTPWDDFVLAACEQNLSGIECLAGIPGRTGGTPVQNVGAYGQEVAQTIDRVRAFDRRSRSFVSLAKEECRFSYRSSCFNTDARGRYLITGVTFALQRKAESELKYLELRNKFGERNPPPLEVYYVVRDIRKQKGMLLNADDPDNRSAGSFFKNPIVPIADLERIAAQLAIEPASVPHWKTPESRYGAAYIKLSAAWLVENAGFSKGFVSGRAGISARHSLALINRGGASFADIASLGNLIRDKVSAQFAILLHQEPVELGPETHNTY